MTLTIQRKEIDAPMSPPTGPCRLILSCLALGLSVLVSPFPGPERAEGDSPPVPPALSSVSVQGSTVTLTLAIPRKPAGRFLHLTVDRGRLMGRKVIPGHSIMVCVGHLSAGRHRLGYELAGRDQIVKTDEVPVPVVVHGGAPYSCPPTGKGS